MTKEINEETGLPHAPEDHRWVIRPKRIPNDIRYGGYHIGPEYFPDPKILEITLQHRTWVPKVETIYSKFRKRPIRTEITGEVDEKWDDTNYTAELKGNNHIAARNAANQVLNRYAENKVRTDLIGTYPPKKLGDAL